VIKGLKNLHLPTLIYTHYRGDMIELFKIINGMYDPTCVLHFYFTELSEDSIRTRGNRYKLTQHHCHYDLRNILIPAVLYPYGTVYPIM